MLKTRKRWVSLLVVVAMLAALLIPMVGPASATASYSMSNIKKVVNSTPAAAQKIGDLEITLAPADASLIASNLASTAQYVYLQVPTSPNGFAIGVQSPGISVINAAGSVTLTPVTGNTTLYLLNINSFTYSTANGDDISANVQILIPLTVTVPGGVTGSISLTASSQSSSVLPGGSITIATVGTNSVTLAVESTPALSSTGGTLGVIDIKEDATAALWYSDGSGDGLGSKTNAVLELTLPPGFSWNGSAGLLSDFGTVAQVWGTAIQGTATTPVLKTAGTSTAPPVYYPDLTGSLSNGNRELDIYNIGGPSASGMYLQFTGGVSVDESTAQVGSITAAIAGTTTANLATAVLGTYGQFSVTADAVSAPSIVAGMAGAATGNLEVKEGVPGGIIAGRTITLTLPTNVAWAEYPSFDSSLSTNYGSLAATAESVGTNGTIAQITFTGSNTTSAPGDIIFNNMEVTPAVDFTGPLTVTVGGSEGVTGTLTLATVTAGITATAPTLNNVGIGLAGQAIGNFSVTENAAGTLQATVTNSYLNETTADDVIADTTTGGTGYLLIVAPEGVTFDTTPSVTVTSGNLILGTVTTGTGAVSGSMGTYSLSPDQGYIAIPINSSSTTASTISVSGATVTVDRTVPSGPVTFKVMGSAVDETTPPTTLALNEQVLFPNDYTAVAFPAATVGTPAPSSSAGTAVFTIGQTTYTINGTVYNMDAAPYISNSRTMLPIRFVADAVGVADSNILWNPIGQTVTIINGGRVVQLTIGNDVMTINGSPVTMDTTPTITDSRTFLPIAWVASALGLAAPVWNATNQTVSITY